MGHFGQQGRIVVATMKGGGAVPRKKEKNRGRTERDIYTRKGGNLDGIIVTKTLDVKETKANHDGNHLQSLVEEVLNEYNIHKTDYQHCYWQCIKYD